MLSVLYQIILIILSCFEFWMYFELSYEMLQPKKYLSKRTKTGIWSFILLGGVLLGINRQVLFFSHVLFVIQVMVVIMCMWFIVRKPVKLIIGSVILYFSFVALLDFMFAFAGMIIVKENFGILIYDSGLRLEKLLPFICTRILLAFIIYYFKKIKYPIKWEENENYVLIFGIIFALLVRYYQLTIVPMAYGDREADGLAGTTSVLFVMFVFSLIGVLLVKNKVLSVQNDFLISKEEMDHRRYEEQRIIVEKNRELIHDMKNHYYVLTEYAKTNEYEKLSQYIEKLLEDFIEANQYVYTGNDILDLILSQKKAIAEQKGIQFRVNTMSFINIPLNEKEICALFGNLLDNAIEACAKVEEDEKKISIRIEERKQMFFVEIRNTIKEVPVIRNNRLISHKKGNNLHGYGLKSVQRIVDAYDGIITYEIEESEFVASLTIFDSK